MVKKKGKLPSICPRCGNQLEPGWIFKTNFLHIAGLLYWVKEKRLFTKYRNLFLPRFMWHWIPASRCKHCSLVLFEAENPSRKAVNRRILKYLLIFLLVVFVFLFLVAGIPLLRLWFLMH